MDENKPLYIPVNTPDADDRVMGLGDRELSIIGGMVIFTFLLCLAMINSSGKIVVVIAAGIVLISGTVFSISRDSYRENLIKKIQIIRGYSKSQKKYEYRYTNIYEGFVRTEEDEL